jgi:predicted nucleic acid-binding protein
VRLAFSRKGETVKRLSIYLDTSVISFLYADDAPELRDITREFFESFLGEYEVSVSEAVLVEIDRTQDSILRNRLHEAVRKYRIPVIHLDPDEESEVASLADLYVAQGVVPVGKREDALHLAIATVREYDVLLSWNYRHLANLKKQVLVNAVNAAAGYLRPVSLLNPMEVMHER